ncbi:hypothetical protein BCY86_08835 [Pajaroellobacter abortibovis]|uniref:Uncharacterized protein n=1 Tax=Pajaroellobacter abortibovis TaxID=1882918 RepID=A0A1L6MZ51_9BACT|nr:hypothetical protein BCY86_08835 [Pajaroellobacter abortibovis]
MKFKIKGSVLHLYAAEPPACPLSSQPTISIFQFEHPVIPLSLGRLQRSSQDNSDRHEIQLFRQNLR